MKSSKVILTELRLLMEELEHGARLPTVRDLMKRFGASQGTVQAALGQLREAGQLSSQVGRGTFVVKVPDGAAAKLPRGQGTSAEGHLTSYLMLSSSRLNERSVLVQNGIQSTLSMDNINVVQMSYQNTDQMLEILRNAPRFGAAMLQSHFDSIPIRLLHLLKEKSSVVVADGLSISGVDIDRVGTDWSEAIDDAVAHLTEIGHRRIGMVTIDGQGRPILAARRYFSRLKNWRGTGLEIHPPMTLANMVYPTQSVADSLTMLLKDLLDQNASLPFTALLVLGVSDGAGLRQSMHNLSIRVPEDLSVHILGHADVPSEHYEFFSMSGPTSGDAVVGLIRSVKDRAQRPGLPPQVTYLPIHRNLRTSTAALVRRKAKGAAR
jgi:DNA-binding LacI/PurR family transcriptional regulator